MADWIVSTRVGFGGLWFELDNEDSHVGGSLEALHASCMSRPLSMGLEIGCVGGLEK